MTTVKASSSYLSEVFAYDPWFTDDSGFPYACLITKGATEDNLDTAYNQITYTYIIRICDANKDKSTMETTIRAVADDMLAELRKRSNMLLWGVVDRVLPFEVSFGFTNDTPMRYVDIQIQLLANKAI